MATQTTSGPSGSTRDSDPADERLGQFDEQLAGATREVSLSALDLYERSLYSWADYAERFAGSSQNTWLAEAARAQAGFTREATRVSTKAARDLLT